MEQPQQIADRRAPDYEPGDEPEQSVGGWGCYGCDQAGQPSGWTPVEVRFTNRLHHQRDREAGKPAAGSLFTYRALEAGQRFVGRVLCPDAATATTVRRLLGAGPLVLGRSRTATYGGSAVVELQGTVAATTWQEHPAARALDKDEFQVELLSDYLGRNDLGTADPGAFLPELTRALGLPPESLQPNPRRTELAARAVWGQVAVWQMPRPTQPALLAGSTWVIRGPRPAADRVAEVQQTGLGERRAEGFGRIALLPLGPEQLAYHPAHQEQAPSSTAPADSISKELFTRLQCNLLREALHQELAEQAVQEADRVTRAPSSSLVARLRGRVRSARTTAEIKQFLEALGTTRRTGQTDPQEARRKRAGHGLRQSRAGDRQPLDEWLRGQLTGWADRPEVVKLSKQLAISLELLAEHDRWILLQFFLDQFCERLRRRSQRRPALPVTKEEQQ